jgi:hypothetical protein
MLLSIILTITLTSCKKEHPVKPAPTPAPARIATRKVDTIPDNACFKLMIQKDSAAIDETMLTFNHTASGAYNSSKDAVYFPGFGAANLASLTTDSIACAIQVIPYHLGKSTRLQIDTKTNGIYTLHLSYLRDIPQTIHIWLQDACRKDSMDLRVGSYAFYVDKKDTTTHGSHRFRFILR